ncbi:hypothetical protein K4105_04460, partial [Buchnera aphidicola]|nr:hypothetical protein [Buchnera aphidicola]
MLILHNRLSKKELKKRVLFENENRLILSFYKYFCIQNVKKYRDDIYKYFYKYKVLGRIYIAPEGINAQMSVPIQYFYLIKNFLYNLDKALN